MSTVRYRYSAGPIQITKHHIDWENLPGSVEARLKAVTVDARFYMNPEYTVTGPADAPLEQFVKQARRVQVLWNKRLARVFGAGGRKRMVKKADPALRQLIGSGVMVLEGVPQNPKGWPDVQPHRHQAAGSR
ncbi:MAG: hypothetical protein K8U57_35245 [Planctomycetes bacterium]|nr:hypothetical protein [Planctomycetota bacterium]